MTRCAAPDTRMELHEDDSPVDPLHFATLGLRRLALHERLPVFLIGVTDFVDFASRVVKRLQPQTIERPLLAVLAAKKRVVGAITKTDLLFIVVASDSQPTYRLARVEQTPRGEVYEVCDADEEDWKAFMESEAPETKCGKKERIDGRIVIVELPSEEHAAVVGSFSRSMTLIPVIDTYMRPRSAVRTPRTHRHLEADLSFAPTPQSEAVLPLGLRWREWHTLRIEIGYIRGWGLRPGQLDWKADQWAAIPGVNYILCVAVEANLGGCIATDACLSRSQHALKLITQS